MFSAKDKICWLLSTRSPADCGLEIREPPTPGNGVFCHGVFLCLFFSLPFFFSLFLLASTTVYLSLEVTAVIR